MKMAKEKELVRLLNEYDVTGVPFVQAKQKILAKGFTEAELVYGLYSAPFDGKVNKPHPPNPLQKFYEQNPDKAEKLAKNLLLAQAEMGWNSTISTTAASSVPTDPHARAYYTVKSADNLGVPYFTLFFAALVLVIAALVFDFNTRATYTLLSLFSLAVNVLFAFLLIQKRHRLHKLRKDAQK